MLLLLLLLVVNFCWRPSCLSREMPTIDMLMNHHGPMKNCHKLVAIGGIPHVHTLPPFRFPSTHPTHVFAGDSSDSERKSPRFSVNFPLKPLLRPPHLVSNPFYKSRTPLNFYRRDVCFKSTAWL